MGCSGTARLAWWAFTTAKARSRLGPQVHICLVLRSSQSGWESSAKWGENFPSWLAMPIKQHSSEMLVGLLFSTMLLSSLDRCGHLSGWWCGQGTYPLQDKLALLPVECCSCSSIISVQLLILCRVLLWHSQTPTYPLSIWHTNIIESIQNLAHPLLIVFWGTGSSKWQLLKAKASEGSDKGCQ